MQKLQSLIFLLFLTITVSGQTVKPVEKNGLYGLTDGTSMIVDYQYDTIKTEYHGQQIEHHSETKMLLQRGDLLEGIYFVQLVEKKEIIGMQKVVVE